MRKISVNAALVSRFFEKVEVGARHQCWNFTGQINYKGYGQFCVALSPGKDVMFVATHIALAIAGSPRPERKIALHHCDNRACVNPSHLYWGTDLDNARDRDMRQRGNWKGKSGATNSQSKLTEQQVREIRASPEGAVATAKKYGVCYASISNIRKRKTWTHI